MLYWNQYRRRTRLGLSAEQIFDARAGARMHTLSVLVGLLSIRLALTPPIESIWIAGAIYGSMGPLHALNGTLSGRARERAFPSSTPALR